MSPPNQSKVPDGDRVIQLGKILAVRLVTPNRRLLLLSASCTNLPMKDLIQCI